MKYSTQLLISTFFSVMLVGVALAAWQSTAGYGPSCSPGQLTVCPVCVEGTPPERCTCRCVDAKPVPSLMPVPSASPQSSVDEADPSSAPPDDAASSGGEGGASASDSSTSSSAATESFDAGTALQDVRDQVNSLFSSIFNHPPLASELSYWQGRVQDDDKPSVAELVGAMQYHLLAGQTMPGRVAGVQSTNLIPHINAIFREVHGHNPTPSENRYWLSRTLDKPTRQAMYDAMLFHKLSGILHY